MKIRLRIVRKVKHIILRLDGEERNESFFLEVVGQLCMYCRRTQILPIGFRHLSSCVLVERFLFSFYVLIKMLINLLCDIK